MELHQARYFVAACNDLNFTRVAKRCNVSQPSLTRAIQLLEQEFGGSLFDRKRSSSSFAPILRNFWRTASTAKQIEGIFGEGTERTESRHHVHDRAEAAPSYRRRSRP
jgi:LysR family transcriptional regulator, hydrogen peroxide-inducible genes activator